MANKPEDDAEDREGLDRYLKRRPRLPRPRRKPDNRMLKPNGRTGAYETK